MLDFLLLLLPISTINDGQINQTDKIMNEWCVSSAIYQLSNDLIDLNFINLQLIFIKYVTVSAHRVYRIDRDNFVFPFVHLFGRRFESNETLTHSISMF